MKKIDVVQPKAMSSAFAEGVYSATGTDNFEIPAATSTAADDSCVLDNGFLPITSTALDNGGKAPERKNFNGIFYLSTDQRTYLQNGGVITFDSAVSTAINGYPQGAILDYISGTDYRKVISLIDDNTYNFISDPSLIDNIHWTYMDIGAYANQSLSNLSTSGNARLHALKGYLDEGELLTDAEGLADVTKMAHSTFDSTKFTPTGAPIVTPDGIASSFSGSDYLTIPNFTLGNNFEISCCFTTGNDVYTDRQGIFRGQAGGSFRIAVETQQNNNRMTLSVSDGTNSIWSNGFEMANNTKYWAKIKVSSGNYIYSYSTDNVNWTADKSGSTELNITDATTLFTVGKNADFPWTGSIDLKYFSVKIGGVPVFTGNQTGISNYHPIPYTLIGTPIISNDGILTGAPGSGLIMSSTPAIATADSWEVQTVYTYNGGGHDPTIFAKSGSANWTGPSFGVDPSGYFKIYLSSNGTSWDLAQTATQLAAVVGMTYYFKVGFTGSRYYIDYNTDGSDTYTNIFSLINSTKCTCNNPLIFMNDGISLNTCYSSGTMDLTKTKVIVNDQTVWEVAPWLNIPYTVSKTGSAIVDSYYRASVQALHEQQGVAPFYTLNEGVDFTLPMGEIYGMFSNRAHIVDTYNNGSSWYRIWSDGWVEQGGRILGGQNHNQGTITFLVPFRDTACVCFTSGQCSHNAPETVDPDTGGISSIMAVSTLTTTSIHWSASATTGFMWRATGFKGE